jgi:hypothetical protein
LHLLVKKEKKDKTQEKTRENKNEKHIKEIEKHNCLISRTIFSIKNQMQNIPLSRNPRDKKRKTYFVFFQCFFNYFHLLFI